jgi:DnaJ-class molecular chaperone
MHTLKSSLRAAAMKWHPDRHAGAAAKRDAEAEFKKCYDAYDALVKRI